MANAVYATLSAFTTSPESGNPAAVVILPPITDSANPVDVFARFPADTALQAIATRFNLPMTAFLLPLSPGRYALRWFTPASEAWICGHATVALSHLLFNVMGEKTDKLSFETIKHGTMHTEARQQQDSKHVQIAVDFPEFTGFIPLDNDGKVKGLLNSLQVEAGQVEEVSQSDHYVLVELKADANLKSINLDEKYLVTLHPLSLLLTQIAPKNDTANYPHIHSRIIGTDPAYFFEDSATGSAHCAIIPYFLTQSPARNRLINHHPEIEASLRVIQQSPRGGEMTVTWKKVQGRVELCANAVLITQGEVEL